MARLQINTGEGERRKQASMNSLVALLHQHPALILIDLFLKGKRHGPTTYDTWLHCLRSVPCS